MNDTGLFSAPKDIIENFKFRERIYMECDPKYNKKDHLLARAEIREYCRMNILFYINGLLYTFDPRKKFFSTVDIPFILFPKQEKFVMDIFGAIRNGEDIALEKSRDEGASWMSLAVLHHMWMFEEGGNSLIGSLNESAIHRSGDMSTLFPKLFYFNKWLPKWMMPEGFNEKLHQNFMNLINPELDTSITGQAGKFFGTSGRYKAVFFDELTKWPDGLDDIGYESSHQTTPCRIAVGTPYGQYGLFYRLVTNTTETAVKKSRIHWTDDPRKTKDLVWLKCEYEDYGKSPAKNKDLYAYFVKQKENVSKNYTKGWQPTSKWYRKECRRFMADPEKGDAGIKQELDIVYLGTGQTYFNQSIVSQNKLMCEKPAFIGSLYKKIDITNKYDKINWDIYLNKKENLVEFEEDPAGLWFIWNMPVKAEDALENQYAFAVDGARGLNDVNDYTAIKVMDRKTRKVVAVYMGRTEFAADECKLIYEFYGKNGYFNPDATGNSTIAIDIEAAGVPLVQTMDNSTYKGALQQRKGFNFNRRSKPEIFQRYKAHLHAGDFFDPDERTWLQMETFINDKGVLKGAGKGQLQSHDDLVDCEALLLLCDDEMPSLLEENIKRLKVSLEQEYNYYVPQGQPNIRTDTPETYF